MAFEEDLEDDDEQQSDGEQQISAPSGLIGQGTDPIQSAVSQQDPTSSGQYTNLQRFLEANQDQATGVADKVGEQIQSRIDQSQNLSSAADQAVRQDVDTQRTFYDEDVLQGLRSGPYQSQRRSAGGLGSFESIRRAVRGDAYRPQLETREQLDQNTYDQIARARTHQYQGPSSAAETGQFQQARNLATEAQEFGNLTGSEAGRFELLRRAITPEDPTYTRGQSRLDQALLSQNEAARQQLADYRTQSENLLPGIDKKMTDLDQYIADVRTSVDQNRKNTQAALDAALRSRIDYFDSASKSMNADAMERYNVLRGVLQDYDKIRDNRTLRTVNDALFYNPNAQIQGQGFNTDMSSVLPEFQAANDFNIMNDAQAAEIEALARLAGQELDTGSERNFVWNPNVAPEAQAFLRNQARDYDRRSTLDDYLSGPLDQDLANLYVRLNQQYNRTQRDAIGQPLPNADQLSGDRFFNPTSNAAILNDLASALYRNINAGQRRVLNVNDPVVQNLISMVEGEANLRQNMGLDSSGLGGYDWSGGPYLTTTGLSNIVRDIVEPANSNISESYLNRQFERSPMEHHDRSVDLPPHIPPYLVLWGPE